MPAIVIGWHSKKERGKCQIFILYFKYNGFKDFIGPVKMYVCAIRLT